MKVFKTKWLLLLVCYSTRFKLGAEVRQHFTECKKTRWFSAFT